MKNFRVQADRYRFFYCFHFILENHSPLVTVSTNFLLYWCLVRSKYSEDFVGFRPQKYYPGISKSAGVVLHSSNAAKQLESGSGVFLAKCTSPNSCKHSIEAQLNFSERLNHCSTLR